MSERPANSNVPAHPGAWALWALAAALPALTTRNPAYLVLLLAAVALVSAALPEHSPGARGWWSFLLKAGLFLWLFTVPYNALVAHYGKTVLFTLPRTIPLVGSIVGGSITLEAAAYGFLSGLGLLTVIFVFATLNRAVDPYQLLRAVPPVLFQTGVMASISLSFIPQAAVALREIREAQAIRGHRWRGLRDVGPLFMPLLTTGLERSLQLAESMEARGFGSAPVRRPTEWRWGQRLLFLALLFMLSGLIARATNRSDAISMGLLAAGALLLVVALVLQGRSVQRTRLRRRRWGTGDTITAAAAILSAAAYIAAQTFRPDWLDYSPYPLLGWPPFQPALGLIFLALAVPALLLPRRPR